MIKNRISLLKKELNKCSRELNINNRKKFGYVDNYGDKWIHFSGKVNEDVLFKAYKDGCSFSKTKPSLTKFNKWFNDIGKKLLNGKCITIYRGIHLNTFFDKDYLKYLKYNLMDRNSWTISLSKAKEYSDDDSSPIKDSDVSLVLKMKCSLDDVHLCFSAWLEGAWDGIGNKEVNLKKSLVVQDITICYIDRHSEDNLKNVGFSITKFNEG